MYENLRREMNRANEMGSIGTYYVFARALNADEQQSLYEWENERTGQSPLELGVSCVGFIGCEQL